MWLWFIFVTTACSKDSNCREARSCEDDAFGLLQFRSVPPSGSFGPWSFGGIVPGDPLYKHLEGEAMPPRPTKGKIPKDFDSRTTWPQCSAVINHIRDQSRCGSCWAVGSVSTLNDRLCVLTGDNHTILSADDPLANCNSTIEGAELPTCVHPGVGGCGGGQLEFVWKWYKEMGVVSGAGYRELGFMRQKVRTCAPYSFPPCHNDTWAARPVCSETFHTPAAFSSCFNLSFQPPYWGDKLKAKSWYKVPSDQIQQEIMHHGSVSCQVQATCSMVNYTGGVYVPSGRVCGGHVMRIIGWGVEEDVGYWWVANSWGSQWGLNGFIKWLRGSDAQGIESGVVAGLI
ncbi:cpr-6 [Symbiodinium natans]|uniref:Cpr-6 protein n=1 Tax=Symbiodinium natans TaxID=878477 RepID=A0A812IHE7_9DINO|nr:cpr-6 [Symbiodinium natans]